MAADRQPKMRAMIMADDRGGAARALAELLPLQQEDFEGLFEAMEGEPVTIRLLDPPLHEFLPHRSSVERELERARDRRRTTSTSWSARSSACRRWRRPTRCSARAAAGWGSCYPEVYEMQVRAIVRGGEAVRERTGKAPLLEIMIPLVDYETELELMRELVDRRRRTSAGWRSGATSSSAR